MKTPYVSELEFDKVTTTSFQVQSKQVREKKTGEPFLALVLSDRTGRVEAKMWDNVHEVKDTFECNDFVKVRGQLQLYNNRRQLTVQKLRRLRPEEVDASDYLPTSKRKPEEMFEELRGIVAGMTDPHLRALLELFLADEKIAGLYRRAPAAKQIHHAFLGGLLEHVLSLCQLCKVTAAHYRNIDCDLLLAGAILHDIGKIHELGYDLAFGYTDDGQLLGHIVIGVRLIEEKLCMLPDFPPRLRTLLEHMVLSHHGTLEFGSPKVPLFPEALLLHYLDDMDSKMECMRSLIETDLNGDKHWTGYSLPLERTVLRKQAFLSGAPEAVVEIAPEPQPERAPAAVPEAPPASPRPPSNGPQAAPPRPPREPQNTVMGEKLRALFPQDK